MRISKAFGRLRELTDALLQADSNVDKSMLYAAAKIIMNYLDDYYTFEDDGVPEGLVEEYLGELDGHLWVLAGYASDRGHPFVQHHTWAISTISKLESPLCMGCIIERQKGEIF